MHFLIKKEQKNIVRIGLILIGLFIVANIGLAATTIGTNILTDGNLTLGGSITSPLNWSTGTAVTAGNYSVSRDADSANQLHFNVPTGSSFEFSVNDVAEATLSATVLNLLTNTLVVNTITSTDVATSVTLQNQTFTAGAPHSAVSITPTWAAENQVHNALNISATQNGANSSTLRGLLVTTTKDNTANTLATMTSIEIARANGTGSSLTTSTGLEILATTGPAPNTTYGINIGDQSLAGGVVSGAINIVSQTASATTTRAINLAGTGVNNAIRFGASANAFSNGAENIRFTDSTNARGIDFTLTAASSQTIQSTGGDLVLAGTTNNGVIITSTVTSAATINPYLTVTGLAHTAMTASTEQKAVFFNFNQTREFGTGALGLQREFDIQMGTIGFVGASTLTNAVGIQINRPPQAGTNATVTNAYALLVGATGAPTTNATNAQQIGIGQLGIKNTYGAMTLLTGLHVLDISGTGISLGNQTATLTNLNSVTLDAITYTSTTNVRTVTNPATLYIGGAPVASTNVTFTNGPYALHVDAGATRFDGRVLESQGADIASASTIALGSDGNSFELTGTTAVNLITSTGWQEGSVITLIANENVTINHATATSGANITILLAGAGNFAMTANDTLTLILSSTTAGGQAWRELDRTVI